MAKFLTRAEYLPEAPTQVGAQVHINHANCPAGTDRKRRLYIKRLDVSTVVAFCHHCGKRGTNKKFNREALLEFVPPEQKALWSLPKDFSPEFSHAAQQWIEKYIPLSVANRWHIGYSEQMRRVILPIWNGDKLACYQARRIYADDPKPKYLTYKNDKGPFFFVRGDSDTVIVVEDMLSAIVLGEQGYSTVALLGTYMTNNIVNHIISNYSGAVVMLDDNNIDVKKQKGPGPSLTTLIC